MAAEVVVSVDVKDVLGMIAGIKARATSFRPVFEEARLFLQTAYAANFAGRGEEVGGWAPYGAWTVRAGEPASLVRTGALAESLMSLRGGPNDVGDREATFGTNIPYAGFHQYGTRNMAARPVVFEPEGFSQFLAERTTDHLIGSYAGFKSLFRHG